MKNVMATACGMICAAGCAVFGLRAGEMVKPGDDLSAAIRANPVVTLSDGVYFLDETVVIDRPVVIRAEHHGKAIVRGSLDFKAADFGEITDEEAARFRIPKFKILKWTVPGALRKRFEGDVARADYPVLLADRKPQFVARGPNASFFRLKDGRVAHERGRKIVDPSADDHPFVRDSLTELDVPSEWFYADGVVYYAWSAHYRWAKAFREKADCQLAYVTAPFFRVKATAQVVFEGVGFQAKVGEAPVVLDGARGARFEKCSFRGTFGGIAGTACGTRIEGCLFEDLLGTAGVELEGDGNVIENCTAQFGGRALRDSKTVFSVSGNGNRVTGCEVSREPGPAIAFAGKDNVIEKNAISRVAHDEDDPSALVGNPAGNAVRDNGIDVPPAVRPPERGLVLVPRPRAYRWSGRPLPPEGYRLKVDKSGEVAVEAADEAGRFYAGQTLKQLPKPYPEIEIEDWPQYPWRGVHLDEARHFFGKAEVLRLLDQMAYHKMNVFHWHLTDDQGWRLQLEGFPELIEWGARRPTFFRYRSPGEQDGKPYGPFFYTKEDVKEILLAAEARHIRVIPEIELPGHCAALMAAHPEFCCLGKLERRVPFDRIGITKDVLCVGNDEAIRFYERIFDEVCKLFPGEYIHIGGDECPTDRWKECPKCQARLKSIGGREIREIHGWLTHHFSDYLTKKGKRVVGYDELLEGGCPTSTTIMNWRDPRDAAKAAKAGNDVVVIWGDRSYFDSAQGVEDDPYWSIWDLGWYVDYIYGFKPQRGFEKEVRSKVLGSQCMLWTEYMLTPDEVEWKLWPRGCAMAEVLWTGDEGREWNEFVTRLVPHVKRLRGNGVNSAPVPDRLIPKISKDLVEVGDRAIGAALYDGKVLVNANRFGVGHRLFAGATLSNDFVVSTRRTEHCALAKVTIPEATEPRLQVDYAWGFGPGATVTVRVRDWTTVEGEVEAEDGTHYFASVFSPRPSRWGVFDGAKSFSTYARQIRGTGCVGYFHENYYGKSGETMQVRTGFSRRSVEEAAAFLAAEMPTFDEPVTRVMGKALASDDVLPVRAKVMDNPSAAYIQRTMTKLESSTADNPATVRILFYGQSVTAQAWSGLLVDELMDRYPTVNFVVRNEAIGGYATDSLVRCKNWDAIPFYPDLVLFHDYGDVPVGYDSILGDIRRKTTAEVVVWSSHLRRDECPTNIVAYAAGKSPAKKGEERDFWAWKRTEDIRALAEKLDFMYIDLQRKWCDTLISNDWPTTKLIRDSVHLNQLGCEYYRAGIGDELVRRPELDGSDCAGVISEFPFAERLEFSGNRVVAVFDGTGDPDASAEVWLDGKCVADAATTNMWAMTRPSVMINWFPGLKDCWFETMPQDEFWTLTILPDDPADKPSTLPKFAKRRKPPMIQPIRFRVDGSRTGFDGEGDSAHAFRSVSGRVNIVPSAFEDYYDCLAPDNPWHQDRPKPGRKIFWRTYPLFAETIMAKPKFAETVLVQGCDNTKHVLEFRNITGRLGVGKLVVHEPPHVR